MTIKDEPTELAGEVFLTLKQIQKKYRVPQVTVRYWIKRGWIEAHKGINKYRKNGIYIKESDWLEFPTFMRVRKKK